MKKYKTKIITPEKAGEERSIEQFEKELDELIDKYRKHLEEMEKNEESNS